MAGRIATGERYGIVVEKGSALLGPLSAAVRELVRDGTVARLAERWLADDPATLRALE
jgi:ABC-type amino acid transport substrate-binding protein